MAFVSEHVSQEDIEKYKLDELWASYHSIRHNKLPKGKEWVIDREKESWLMDTGRIRDKNLDHAYLPEQIWTLHYKGERVEFRIEVSNNDNIDGITYNKVWDLLDLSNDSLENLSTQEMITLLGEGLKINGTGSIKHQKPNYRVALRDCRGTK